MLICAQQLQKFTASDFSNATTLYVFNLISIFLGSVKFQLRQKGGNFNSNLFCFLSMFEYYFFSQLSNYQFQQEQILAIINKFSQYVESVDYWISFGYWKLLFYKKKMSKVTRCTETIFLSHKIKRCKDLIFNNRTLMMISDF